MALSRALLCVLTVVACGCVGAQRGLGERTDPDTSELILAEVEVAASNCGWVLVTELSGNDVFRLSSSGRWRVSAGEAETDLDGVKEPAASPPGLPLPEARLGELIGRLDGAPFRIGAGISLGRGPGKLEARINDAACADNEGQARLRVTRPR